MLNRIHETLTLIRLSFRARRAPAYLPVRVDDDRPARYRSYR